jgi:hypothetical protein
MRRRRLVALALFSCLLLVLSACGGGRAKQQLNPPRASVQQLTVLPNGQWRLVLRVQNFSNVPSTFTAVSGRLKFAGHPAGDFNTAPNISIGPESADTVEATVMPSLEAKLAVASALSASQSIRYEIEGQIATSQRNAPYDFKYESSLNPAPGLPGVMR